MNFHWGFRVNTWHAPCEREDMLMKFALPDFLRHPLGREIAIALVVKLAVIVAIFYAFFHGNTVATDPDAVAQRLATPQQQTSH